MSRRLVLPVLLALPLLLAAGKCSPPCDQLVAAREAVCTGQPGGAACVAATAAAASCAPAPSPTPTTCPDGLPPFEGTCPPVLPPVTPPPTLPPGPAPSGCALAGAAGLEPVPSHVQLLGTVVNVVMAELTGCQIGSTCLLYDRPQEWQRHVTTALRARGLGAGQHAPDSDEIAVSADCTPGAVWEAYHIAAGPGWDTPGGRLTVVWSYGTQTEPVPGPPEHYVGANRPAWRPSAPPEPPVVTPPPVAACPYRPLPAARRINAKAHVGKQLDSTPQVGDSAYCAARGWTDGRTWCAVAQEGDPARTACEAELLGRPCPVWRLDSGEPGLRLEYSGEEADVAHCGADAGFLVWVVGSGSGAARACNADGSLCSAPVAVTR